MVTSGPSNHDPAVGDLGWLDERPEHARPSYRPGSRRREASRTAVVFASLGTVAPRPTPQRATCRRPSKSGSGSPDPRAALHPEPGPAHTAHFEAAPFRTGKAPATQACGSA